MSVSSTTEFPERFRVALRPVIQRVVDGDFDGLVRDGFTATVEADLGMWVRDYFAELVSLPEEAWQFASYGRINVEPAAWYVVVDLWTAEEGHSDLSLEATLRETASGITVEITNIHVL